LFKPCAYPRCSELLTQGNYCSLHKPKEKTFNTSPEQHKHYTSEAHRFWRETILARDPLCVSCLRKNILTPSTVAHHKDGNWKNIDLNNGEGLCAQCHTPNFHEEKNAKILQESRM